MAVEIFREPELEELLQEDKSQEWKELCDNEIFAGQKNLIKNDSEPSMYILMNEATKNMFSVLCSSIVPVERYKESTIPVDVLKEILLCDHKNYFHKIYIAWDEVEKDPIVIGKITDKYDSPLHLIARWGDEILPFSELRIKAKNRLIESIKNQHEKNGLTIGTAVEDWLSGNVLSLNYETPRYSFW